MRVHDASKMFVFKDGAFVEQPDPSGERIDDLACRSRDHLRIHLPRTSSPGAPRLKWINAPSCPARSDRFLAPEIVESRVILTNSRGIHPVQMGETVFEMLLMLAKKAPLFFRMKEERRWQRTTPGICSFQDPGQPGIGRDRSGGGETGQGLRHEGDRHGGERRGACPMWTPCSLRRS